MDCHRAIERILEADLEELRGGDTELSAHLTGCAACREAADRVLAMEADLGGWLRGAEAGREPGWRVAAQEVPDRRIGRTPGSAPRRTFWPLFLPAAAAALAGLLLLDRSPTRESDPPFPLLPSTQTLGPPPLVESAPGKNIVVLETQNPKVTLVWLY